MNKLFVKEGGQLSELKETTRDIMSKDTAARLQIDSFTNTSIYKKPSAPYPSALN